MTDIRSRIYDLYTLEQLAAGQSPIHILHPLAKLLAAAIYIICVVSLGRYDVISLVLFALYPVLLIKAAQIPFAVIFKRSLIALPFCLFIGISGLFFETATILQIGPVAVSYGMMALFALLARSMFCVAAVLILVAVTPFAALTNALRCLRIPVLFVALLEMTYRYIGVLLEEAASLYTAYKLRNPGGPGVAVRDMGLLIGQLFLRSFGRAERIYQAMQCRGYALERSQAEKHSLQKKDFLFLLFTCAANISFRIISFIFL